MSTKFFKNNGILWRRIGILCIFIIILLILITSYLIFSKGRRSCDNACTTENCLKSVREMAENANQEVDPCQNFYSFTCGKWIKRYENETLSVTDQMKHTVQLSIKDVLSGLESNSSTKSGKIRIVYDSCIDYDSSEMNSAPSIKKFFKLLGMEDWPDLPNGFNFTSPSLEETIGILIGYNEFPFINVKRGKENKNKLYEIMVSLLLLFFSFNSM
ncbi:membrane metallo-endopeptidase-like 1 [Parasteatoda tepidariorum]|uniref:membrane metallo-endopeptidase-like 1 n=1 Tax=Parasteatoda tepidariorum TaxID=114398 RepID=UPI0039BCAE15